VIDFINEDSPDRRAFIDSQLARLVKTPKPETKPLPRAEEMFPGDFLTIEGSWPVSRDLAKKLSYSVGYEDE